LEAELELKLASSSDTVLVGDGFMYTLSVTNAGPNLASDVVLTNILPASISLLSLTSSQGSLTNINGTIVCSFGDLAPGSGASLTILVSPTAPAALTNRASVLGNEAELI
jgi:uncharacterized repeat protein (TIGR01451 family)